MRIANLVTMKNKYVPILVSLILAVYSCGNNRKPKTAATKFKASINIPDKYYLHTIKGIPYGIIRVECKDCELKYSFNHNSDIIPVKNGDEDRAIAIKHNTLIKTTIYSHENQMIRIVAFDPNGNIVSNVLDTFKKGDQRKNDYLLKYTRSAKTIIVEKPSAK